MSGTPDTFGSDSGVGGISAPTGVIVAFAGSAIAPSSGWILCDGSAVSRAAYPALFALIGVTYGAGDGTTTFNVPDLQGRVIVGVAPGGKAAVNALAKSDGLIATLRSIFHYHPVTASVLPGSSPLRNDAGGSGYNGVANTGGDTDNQNAPAFLVLNYIIKT